MIENALIRQVLSLPELIEQQYNDLEPKARKALTTPEIFGIQRIVLTWLRRFLCSSTGNKTRF